MFVHYGVYTYKTDQTCTCSDPEKIETIKFTTF